jgi:hypothetical protein
VIFSKYNKFVLPFVVLLLAIGFLKSIALSQFTQVSYSQNLISQSNSKSNINYEQSFYFDDTYSEITQDFDELELEDFDSEFVVKTANFSNNWNAKQPAFYGFQDRNKKTIVPLYLLYCNLKIAICC